MIYLIDDKRDRQAKDYNWNFDRLSKYKNELKPIYSLQQIDDEKLRDNIFSEGSIIFIHESFFENIENKHIKDSLKIREDLREKALKKNIWLVYFSGSKNSRTIEGRIVHIPVSILYKNLEVFIEKKIEKKIDLNYILFGKNPKIESEIINKLEKSNNDFDSSEIQTNSYNLFFHVEGRQNLPLRINNSVVEKLIVGNQFENQITDLYIHHQVINFLSINEYENVFIPLCFGPTLSDYNGLRLATHIRCTPTKNQLKPIFIYGFVDYTFLVDNVYFDILKTKNVFLIGYSKKCFEDALNNEISDLTINLLPQEIKKINLKIPSNYEDNHSIANEWAIYRWSQTIDAKDKNIEKIIELQSSNLYFKYLKTIYPISQLDKLESEQLKIKYEGSPKILYIDDEAEKGWYEIFCEILYKKNEIDFTYLDDEFNEKTQEEIVDLSIKKVIDENIDLVILDFRLHKEDFENKNIKEITGYQILKKIKQYNKGIQVIVFSATNKIWNLQALQDAGADGFILKESPENSIDSEFTKQSVENLINTIDKCFNSIFLKDFYTKLEILKGYLIPRKNYKKSNNPLPKEFVDETLKWYELSLSFLNIGINEEQLISTFLIYFTIIENISNRVIEVENPIKEGDFYKFQFRKNLQRLNNYIEDNQKPGFYRKTNSKYKSSKRNLRWDIKIYNTIDFISENKLSIESINVLVKKRNDIIHSNSTFGNVIEIKKDNILLLNKIIFEGLMNVI